MLATFAALRPGVQNSEENALLDDVEHYVKIAVNDADHIRRLRHNGLQQEEVIKQLCHELLQPQH